MCSFHYDFRFMFSGGNLVLHGAKSCMRQANMLPPEAKVRFRQAKTASGSNICLGKQNPASGSKLMKS